MPAPTSHADDITMSGGGLYSLATKGARDVIDRSTPLVLSALEGVDFVPGVPFTFMDMGCADGGTSLGMVGSVVEAARQRDATHPVQIIYSDQPRNDYNALVRIVHGLTDFPSYLARHDEVYVMVSATSFYRQIVPANTLHLGFSATAMHWLSTKPCNISNHVHAVGATGEELESFAAQARADWETILLHRARELRVGGRLVLVMFCRDESGFYLGNTGGVNMFDTFNDIWQAFLEAGTVTRDEYVAMTLPQYYRTVEEFAAPFEDPASAVSRAGLRLDSIETRIVPCPFARDFQSHGDAGAFAAAYLPTIRSWNESIFLGALSRQRSEQQRRGIIEDYYRAYQDRVAAGPDGHGMDYVHAYMVISRVQSPGDDR